MNRVTHGFTLAEVLVAAGVLSFLLVPIMLSFSAGNRGIQMTSEEFSAQNAAIELLEQLSATPFHLLPTGTFNNALIRSGGAMSPTCPIRFHVSDIFGVDREVKITELKKDGLLRFKKIEIVISWKALDGKGTPRSIALKGLVANESL